VILPVAGSDGDGEERGGSDQAAGKQNGWVGWVHQSGSIVISVAMACRVPMISIRLMSPVVMA